MSEKIKILYIIPTLKQCGPVNILYGIIKNLDFDKFDIHVVTLKKEPIESKISEFNELGVKVHCSDMSRVKSIIKGEKYVLDIIRKVNPNIIHSHGFRPDKITSKIKNRLTFTTLHNYPHKDYIMTYGKIIGHLMYKKHFKYLKNIKYTISCSKSISDELKQIFNIDTMYIQNGINIKYFSSEMVDKENLRLNNNIPKDKKIILSVGVLNNRKDPIKIIKSFKESKLENDYLLILVGNGELLEECRLLANENILVLGNRTDIKDILCMSDVFVSASKAEGLPNAVLEAMACKLPVILSDIPPHREILDYNMQAGILFKNDNYIELVNIFDKLERLNLDELSINSKKIVSENFTDLIMSQKYEEKYLMCMSE